MIVFFAGLALGASI